MNTLDKTPDRPIDRSDSHLCELVSQLKGSPPKKVIDKIEELLDEAPIEEAARALDHERLRRCSESVRLAIRECGRQSSGKELYKWILDENKRITSENKSHSRKKKKKLAGNRQLVYLTLKFLRKLREYEVPEGEQAESSGDPPQDVDTKTASSPDLASPPLAPRDTRLLDVPITSPPLSELEVEINRLRRLVPIHIRLLDSPITSPSLSELKVELNRLENKLQDCKREDDVDSLLSDDKLFCARLFSCET